MGKFVALLFTGVVSLFAVDVPLDTQLQNFSLPQGMEIWLREYASSDVACRFVSHSPRQGKPKIFDFDCSIDEFDEALPSFLEDCEEEMEGKGGSPIGLVAVGPIHSEALYDLLKERYAHKENGEVGDYEAVQFFPEADLEETDLCLSYVSDLPFIQTDQDVKKLWTLYLIQSMAEGRLKQAAVDCGGAWKLTTEARYLLPAITTVGYGAIQHSKTIHLLTQFLEAIQILKEQGFTESELADCQSRLQKRLQRFNRPSVETIADYYASHLAAHVPCTDYTTFIGTSLRVVPEITIADIATMFRDSLLDETRALAVTLSEEATVSKEELQQTLDAHPSNDLVFNYDAPPIVDGQDPFSQLSISDEEKKTMRELLKTVAETSLPGMPFKVPGIKRKEAKLARLHPLRSLATMVSDPHIKKHLCDILAEDGIKKSRFLGDFSEKMQKLDGDLMVYVPGFAQATGANPTQVQLFLRNKEFGKLVEYVAGH